MANKIAFSQKQLTQMKMLYESDTAIKKIASRFDCSYNTIRNIAVKYEWVKGDSIALIQARVSVALKHQEKLEYQQNTERLDNELQVIQKSLSNHVLEHQILSKSQMLQLELIETTSMINLSIQSFIKANPGGFYIRSQGNNGTTYGLVADVLTNVAQMIASTQRVVGNIDMDRHLDLESNKITQPQLTVMNTTAKVSDTNAPDDIDNNE